MKDRITKRGKILYSIVVLFLVIIFVEIPRQESANQIQIQQPAEKLTNKAK
jgi:hypothetical protein